MALTTQDLIRGIDITGLNSVSGSQLNQLVDVARTASDKGMIVETEDSALDTPVVPNPNNNYSGITPLWWKRYIWRRILDDETIKNYVWNPSLASDPTLLRWELIDKDGKQALIDAAAAQADADAAQNTADTALTNANNAQTTADDAATAAENANNNAIAAQTAIGNLEDTLATLWAAGDIKATTSQTVYSTVENQGWLDCDGSEVDRDEFASLFAAIGIAWGSSAADTFKVPDFRGRALIGVGQGAGLTLRNRAVQNIGVETVQLTSAQSGLPAHSHNLLYDGINYPAAKSEADGIGSTSNSDAGGGANATGREILTIAPVVAANAASAHDNMMPAATIRYLIKT